MISQRERSCDRAAPAYSWKSGVEESKDGDTIHKRKGEVKDNGQEVLLPEETLHLEKVKVHFVLITRTVLVVMVKIVIIDYPPHCGKFNFLHW